MPRKQAETRSMQITNATEYQPSIIPTLLRAGAINLFGPSTALSLHNQTRIRARMANKISAYKFTCYEKGGSGWKIRQPCWVVNALHAFLDRVTP
jgi:hypothetical protein